MDVDLKRDGTKNATSIRRDRRVAFADWACPDLMVVVFRRPSSRHHCKMNNINSATLKKGVEVGQRTGQKVAIRATNLCTQFVNALSLPTFDALRLLQRSEYDLDHQAAAQNCGLFRFSGGGFTVQSANQ